MTLRKGDKVEVMNKKDGPVSWRVAEILSGNGHTYCVKCDPYPGMASEQMVETVSRKLVRPCPPLVKGVENCIVGDIVEVFYEYSWKIAAILKILKSKKEFKSKKIPLQAAAVQKQYLVRLLGCPQELVVDESNIRMRQTWHDDNWILVGKRSKVGEDVKANKPSTSNCCDKINFQITQFNGRGVKNQPQTDCANTQDEAAFWEPHVIPSRSLKRLSPYGSSIVEEHNGCVQKLKVIEKDGMKLKVAADPVLEKVDAVAYPIENLGEKNMHASFKTISAGYNQIGRAKLSDVLAYCRVRNSENNSDSDSCSVGSCSITDQSPTNFYIPFAPLPCQETDSLCSDAESCNGSGSERKSSSLPPKEEIEDSIRRLELCAYRRTLEALYASGPLSWEQEALLTNLRIVLHISNDEHLMELKHLISARTGPQLEAGIICFQGFKMMPRFASLLLASEFWTIQLSTLMQPFIANTWYQKI